MMRVPGLHGSLEASWESSFKIIDCTSDVNYCISPVGCKTRSKSKVVHINLLKEFKPNFQVFSVVAIHSNSDDILGKTFSPSISPHLSLDKQSSLHSLLSQHFAIFSEIPGCTETTSHCISVTSDNPVWTPSYTIPVHVEKGFQQSVDELLTLGIIEPSQSRWSSPPIPIIKKDGSIRIVIDYRKFHLVTLAEPFQMPTITEIISRLGNATYLSKLDFKFPWIQSSGNTLLSPVGMANFNTATCHLD